MLKASEAQLLCLQLNRRMARPHHCAAAGRERLTSCCTSASLRSAGAAGSEGDTRLAASAGLALHDTIARAARPSPSESMPGLRSGVHGGSTCTWKGLA